MIVYHGTSDRRARRICEDGFFPKKPSRRVWFATGRGYALRRAKVQARRRRDRPVVLTCEINLAQMRKHLGPKRVFYGNGVIAIDGDVPVTVLRSHPDLGQPSSPQQLATWVNQRLGLKPYKGVGQRHPGIQRLSRWVVNRLSSQPHSQIAPAELLAMACQWLPEFFEGFQIDAEHLRHYRKVGSIEVETQVAPPQPDPREQEALDCLFDASPKQRVRGLSLLSQTEVVDLFDWCVMLLDDESVSVRLAALQIMLRCQEGDPETILPLATAENKRIRGAAVAVLAKHSGQYAPYWFERGLKDPSPCVRVETAKLLAHLEPIEHRSIFELALYDPNPEVARLARKLTAGKGFAKPTW